MKSPLYAMGRLCLLLTWAALASATEAPPPALFQVSTIHALMEGVYDGALSLGELKQHGDFGIGTFDRLDGELILHQGEVYQVLHGGEVRRPGDGLTTPFAAVHAFTPELRLTLTEPIQSLAELKTWLDRHLPSRNALYGLRIQGRFDYIQTRSVPAAERPYPPLVELAKRQNLFSRDNVSGVMLGYWLPDYLSQVNVPGYHLHFLSDDRAFGGHLLDCRLRAATVEIDPLTAFQVRLPDNPAFLGQDLSRFSSQDLHAVEVGAPADPPAAPRH